MTERASPAPAELVRALAVLAEPPAEGTAEVAHALGLGAPPTRAEHADLFVFQLYPYASVHLGAEGMMGGDVRDRIAGFWRAVGHAPPAEPDHLAALLGLYAALGDQAGSTTGAEGALLAESRNALLHEHLAPWLFGFLARCRELSAGFHRLWAELLEGVLARAVRADVELGARPLAAHLQLAPPLPDPREEDAAAFVSALLAPIRSGMILTRADLARVATSLDLGLRAGERRYALEHLLSQSAEPVLRALATEARRQGAQHRERSAWLGAAARFHAERAERAARLLGALASESGTPAASRP